MFIKKKKKNLVKHIKKREEGKIKNILQVGLSTRVWLRLYVTVQ